MRGQSRTGGIGRAILDTFPIIKFGQAAPEPTPEPKGHDVESEADRATDRAIELTARDPGAENLPEEGSEGPASAHDGDVDAPVAESSSAATSQPRNIPTSVTSGASNDAVTTLDKDVKPSAIGHDTCPICIVSQCHALAQGSRF